MFEIKNGKISLNKTKTLTPKQIATINQMHSEKDRTHYIMSLMGLVKKPVPVDRIKVHGEDVLHDKPKSTILKRMQRLQNLDRDHKPSETALGQWVGVEVECIIPKRDGHGGECECEYDIDGDLDVECQWCMDGQPDGETVKESHRWLKGELLKAGVTRCCIKFDGSLEDEEGNGVEVTILFNSKYGFEPLTKLCAALKKAGCYVNETCGLHVHLDARHLTVKAAKRVGDSLGHSLPVLKYIVDASRRTNTYCPLKVSKLMKINRNDDTWDERYAAINMTAYHTYKTIEVRLHQGSLDSDKIESWVNLLKLIGGSKLKAPLHTFQELIDLDGFTESMIQYCEGRITKLNPDAWPLLIKGPDRADAVADEHIGGIIDAILQGA